MYNIISINELWEIYHLSSSLVCMLNKDGCFKHVNPSFLTLLGYTEEELLGKPFTNIVHPDDVLNIPTIESKMGMTNQVVQFTNRMMAINGDCKYFTWSFSMNKKQEHIYALAIDVTEKMESEQNYKSLFDNSPLPSIIYDASTLSIININNAALQHYGYSSEEFLEISIPDLMVEETNLREIMQIINNGTVYHGSCMHIKKSGEMMNVEATCTSITYQKVNAVLAVIKDVTEVKHQQQRITEQHNCLRDIAWKQSHLMRSPLANLKGLLPMVKDNPSEGLFISYMQTELEKLDKIIIEMVLESAAIA